jgi:SOS-response transcriptional repressor LexA
MKVGEYLRKLRHDNKLSLRKASTLSGISATNIMDIENGRISPSFDKILKLLNVYHANLNDFIENIGYFNIEPSSLKTLKRVPLLCYAHAGKWVKNYHLVVDEFILTDMEGDRLFALRVKGDSMAPEFNEGEIIVVNPDVCIEPNDYVIAINHDDEAIFKQYKKYQDVHILHSLNPKYPDIEMDDRYRLIGKVVEKKKRY